MEAVLWRALQRKQLGGFKFRRQEPMGPYFLDFYCREARLAVEVDGATHVASSTDPRRTAYLVEREIEVLRFWNNDVMSNLDGVLAVILERAECRCYRPPPGTLPQTREGE